MIDIKSFEAEITDYADVFIGPSRAAGRSAGRASDEPYLYVVLPSFSFKVRLTQGNLQVLRIGVDEWTEDEGD